MFVGNEQMWVSEEQEVIWGANKVPSLQRLIGSDCAVLTAEERSSHLWQREESFQFHPYYATKAAARVCVCESSFVPTRQVFTSKLDLDCFTLKTNYDYYVQLPLSRTAGHCEDNMMKSCSGDLVLVSSQVHWIKREKQTWSLSLLMEFCEFRMLKLIKTEISGSLCHF